MFTLLILVVLLSLVGGGAYLLLRRGRSDADAPSRPAAAPEPSPTVADETIEPPERPPAPSSGGRPLFEKRFARDDGGILVRRLDEGADAVETRPLDLQPDDGLPFLVEWPDETPVRRLTLRTPFVRPGACELDGDGRLLALAESDEVMRDVWETELRVFDLVSGKLAISGSAPGSLGSIAFVEEGVRLETDAATVLCAPEPD
jgi:hypothetical protein